MTSDNENISLTQNSSDSNENINKYLNYISQSKIYYEINFDINEQRKINQNEINNLDIDSNIIKKFEYLELKKSLSSHFKDNLLLDLKYRNQEHQFIQSIKENRKKMKTVKLQDLFDQKCNSPYKKTLNVYKVTQSSELNSTSKINSCINDQRIDIDDPALISSLSHKNSNSFHVLPDTGLNYFQIFGLKSNEWNYENKGTIKYDELIDKRHNFSFNINNSMDATQYHENFSHRIHYYPYNDTIPMNIQQCKVLFVSNISYELIFDLEYSNSSIKSNINNGIYGNRQVSITHDKTDQTPFLNIMNSLQTIFINSHNCIFAIYFKEYNIECFFYSFKSRCWRQLFSVKYSSPLYLFRSSGCMDEIIPNRLWFQSNLDLYYIDIPNFEEKDLITMKNENLIHIHKVPIIQNSVSEMRQTRGANLHHFRNSIYLFGGNEYYVNTCPVFRLDLDLTETSSTPQKINTSISDAKKFTLISSPNQWQLLKTFGEAPLNGYCTSSIRRGKYIYLFGSYSTPMNDLYRFDLLQWTWEKLLLSGNIPRPRFDCSLLNIGSYVVICGGKDQATKQELRDCYFVEAFQEQYSYIKLNSAFSDLIVTIQF